jgi:glutathione reductase (NADPH)
MTFDYDLIVVGAGSGGVRAARVAASHGAKVAIAEESRRRHLRHSAAFPKLYVLASRFHDDFKDAAGFGWRVGDVSFDWPALVAAKEKEITRLSDLYAETLASSGVELIRARARSLILTACVFQRPLRPRRYILIATGGMPCSPHIPGIEPAYLQTRFSICRSFHRRLLIVGAGYIAVEFASVFARLGAKVHLAYRADLPLRAYDDDLRSRLCEALKTAGVAHRAGALPTRITKSADVLEVEMSDGAPLEVDCLLIATGRRPIRRILAWRRRASSCAKQRRRRRRALALERQIHLRRRRR